MGHARAELLDVALDRLRAAGLYDPSSPTAVQRAELLEYLLARFSLDEILHWISRTNLTGVAARAIDRPPALISADEVAIRSGVAVDTVLDVRTAFGFPVIDTAVPSMPETVIDDVRTFVLGAELFGGEEALASAPVLGWAAARVMEAARAMFGSSVERLDVDARTELQIREGEQRHRRVDTGAGGDEPPAR